MTLSSSLFFSEGTQTYALNCIYTQSVFITFRFLKEYAVVVNLLICFQTLNFGPNYITVSQNSRFINRERTDDSDLKLIFFAPELFTENK